MHSVHWCCYNILRHIIYNISDNCSVIQNYNALWYTQQLVSIKPTNVFMEKMKWKTISCVHTRHKWGEITNWNPKYYEKKVFTCDGHQFHQYQQNEKSPLSLTHCTQNKPMTYDVGNPGHAFVMLYL